MPLRTEATNTGEMLPASSGGPGDLLDCETVDELDAAELVSRDDPDLIGAAADATPGAVEAVPGQMDLSAGIAPKRERTEHRAPARLDRDDDLRVARLAPRDPERAAARRQVEPVAIGGEEAERRIDAEGSIHPRRLTEVVGGLDEEPPPTLVELARLGRRGAGESADRGRRRRFGRRRRRERHAEPARFP